jgi:hypothetical protein
MRRITFLHHFPSRKFADVGPDFVICRGSALLGRCFIVAMVRMIGVVVVVAALLTKEEKVRQRGRNAHL